MLLVQLCSVVYFVLFSIKDSLSAKSQPVTDSLQKTARALRTRLQVS